jgi:23S rRNA pseudouridine1911/1915/1917 synthase
VPSHPPQYSDDWFVAWHASYQGQAGPRLDEEVGAHVPALSRERRKAAFAESRVTVGGKPGSPGDRPAKGARIEVSVGQTEAAAYRAGARGGDGFFLLYKDDDVLVVDKDPGVLTVPTDEGMKAGLGQSGDESLIERIADALQVSPRTVIPVHRLDRFTSGVLVVARNAQAKERLVDQFAVHAITRRYIALTRGVPSPRAGTFRSHLASDARRLQHVARTGELAVTHYEVMEELRNAAVVLVVLETGKRNQIRVHFAEAGWPLVGEQRYGAGARARRETRDSREGKGGVSPGGLDRQALHAAELEFLHPKTGKPVSAASPLPADMGRFVERNRLRASTR